MTAPAKGTGAWDQPIDAQANAESAQQLSRMVSGNNQLVTQPGLVQALFQGNATPQQAQAINQFMVGLDAEKQVQLASQENNKIALSQDQQNALSAMNVPFQHVMQTPQDQLSALTAQMAANGMKPVLDSSGNVQTDANGNVLASKITTAAPAKKQGGFGHFLHDLGNNPITSLIVDGSTDASVPNPAGAGGIKGAVTAANEGYQYLSTVAGESHELATNPYQYTQSQDQDSDLAKQLGYNPSSFFSMQAFKARGLAHTDTSGIAADFDNANPQGLNGWDGTAAVTQAEAFAANPTKYQANIVANAALTPEQVQQQVEAISSPQFQKLVAQVQGSRADIGAEYAKGIGIDPVKHAEAFNLTSGAIDLAASFVLDPLAMAGGFVRAERVSSTAVNFTDADRIRQVLDESGVQTMAQANVINNLKSMVGYGNQMRDAVTSGDKVLQAQIQARADVNPFGGFLSDFMNEHQILGTVDEETAKTLGRADSPFITGKSDDGPIDTYAKAVDYLASKSALLRLTGGIAPVEATYMPGAMSSFAYQKVHESLASFMAGRAAQKSIAGAEKFVSAAEADPEKYAALLKSGELTKVLPESDDAIDALSGKVIAAQTRLTAAEQLAAKWAGEAGADATAAPVAGQAAGEVTGAKAGLASAQRALEARKAEVATTEITDAGRGAVRRNELTYGRATAPESILGRVAAYGTTGIARRAGVVADRFSNWLPRETTIDINSAEAGDTLKKVARTYMNRGDANMFKARWSAADLDTRKAMVQGLRAQIAHAAGLTKTQAGRDLITSWEAADQHYSQIGEEILDSNGKPVGLHPGQMQTKFQLPDFGQVHKAASKVGLFEGTMGRLLDTNAVTQASGLWRSMILLTGYTAIRANTESWINAMAEGHFMDSLRAKALLRENGLLDRSNIPVLRATAALKKVAPIAMAGRFYRHVLLSSMPDDLVEALSKLPDDIAESVIHEQQAGHYAIEVDPSDTTNTRLDAAAGFPSRKITLNPENADWAPGMRKLSGFELADYNDGLAGANAYAANLGQWMKDPNLTRTILDHIEDPAGTSTQDVRDALEANPLMQHSQFGQQYKDANGVWQKATTDAQKDLGKTAWAEKLTAELQSLVTGRNAVVNQKLTDYLRSHDTGPSADWVLDNVKGMDRPQAVLHPMYQAVAPGNSVSQMMQAAQDLTGKGYTRLIESPIQRHTTTPMFAAAFANSKAAMSGWEARLVEGGLSPEAADRISTVAATQQAWSRVARMVDDFKMRSQLDVVGRSFFAFSRATTMMLRRWSSTAWRNPAAARRLMLTGEAAVHSGLVYTDQNGQLTFAVPMSGVAQQAIRDVMSKVPGLSKFASFPSPADFTGRVASIIPGSDNPFQYQTTPIVSIAARQVANFFPDHRELFDEVDQKLNGSAGQGQGIVASLEPTAIKRLTDITNPNDRASITASAMVGSLYNLYAAGQVPPAGASSTDIDTFLNRLKNGTKGQLFLRAALGMVSPMTLNSPDNENSASEPDFAFSYGSSGVKGLRQEYTQLLNETGGDVGRATAIFTALHPDKTVFEESASGSTTKDAVMPATQEALDWMQQNDSFIKKYSSVSGYFIPEASQNGKFSYTAYRAQLEDGLRQKKTPTEFFNAVRTATAGNAYYAQDDQYKTDLAAYKAAGDTTGAAKATADWQAWSSEFKSLNPIFGEHLAGSADGRGVTAPDQLRDLESMVKNGDVPDKKDSETLAGMLSAYNGYKAYEAGIPGSDTNSEALKSVALGKLQDYMTAALQYDPALTDVYRGVFRVLNSNLTDPNATTGVT